MAKAELHQHPLLDAYLRQLGTFPEGTRSKGKGLRPAKTGAAPFVLYARCPIIPVTITGTGKILK